MRKYLNDFKAFALKGNVLDLAVGVMIGAAFGKVVSSLVSDIFMPLLGLLTDGLDFGGLFIALDGKAYPTMQAANDAGTATLNYGMFIATVIDFALIAFCIFLLVKAVAKLTRKKAAAEEKQKRLCPYCKSTIDDGATRCPACTSRLE